MDEVDGTRMSMPDPRWYDSPECLRGDVKALTWLVILQAVLIWTYVADNGVQAWTDDLANVPAAYEARARELGTLADYPKLTCEGTCPGVDED